MCRNLIIAGIKPDKVDLAWKFAKNMGKLMSRGNTDGLGYAAITKEGRLFGERWLKNDDAFSKEDPIDLSQFTELLSDSNAMTMKGEYNNFGEITPDEAVAITLHTRFATSPRGMLNTHPFMIEGTTLIHNGSISNHEEFKLQTSTCDSEAILLAYLANDVGNTDPSETWQNAANMLQGYYACGVLTNTTTGPIVDIFRNGAMLSFAWIKELDTYVISTNDSDIKDTCRDLGWSFTAMSSLRVNKFLRVNAVTGNRIALFDFKDAPHRSYTKHYPVGGYNSQTGRWEYESDKKTPAVVVKDKATKDNVFNIPRKRGNTDIPADMKEYFTSGQVSCKRLTDHEVMEEIANCERRAGRI